MQLTEVRGMALAGRLQPARERLGALCDGRIEARGGHFVAARLACELGMIGLARRELHLALRDRPDDPNVLYELAELHADRGDLEQEAACRERLREIDEDALDNAHRLAELYDALGLTGRAEQLREAHGLEQGAEAIAEAEEPESDGNEDPILQASDADLVRFLHLFAGREDVHARQWYSPQKGVGYSPVRRPLTPDLVRSHLLGSVTLGVYPIRLDGTVTFFALDLDITRRAIQRARGDRDETQRLRRLVNREGCRLQSSAAELGLTLLLEDSGYKGRHLWGFFAQPLPADLVRKLGRALANTLAPRAPELSLEVFPRQSKRSKKGLGNLIKLPLGIHLRSGRRALFLDERGGPLPDAWPLLRRARRLTRDEALDALARLHERPVDDRPHDENRSEEDDAGGPPGPAPLPPRAPFTEADFETQPEMAAVLRGCPVLSRLIHQGLERRRLSHDERVVVRHALGHLPVGVAAVNYVFERCPEIGAEDYLKSRLRGNPISCPRIRQRVPHVTARVPCQCAFPTRPDHYPTPLLHLDEARARGRLAEPVDANEASTGHRPLPEDLARTISHLEARRRRLEAELEAIRGAFVDRLEELPERALPAPGGRWALEDVEGMPTVVWHPDEEDS